MSPRHHAIRGEGIMHNNTARASAPTAAVYAIDGQSDAALIKAIAAGNRSAMRTFYLRHNVRVFRFITRLVADLRSGLC